MKQRSTEPEIMDDLELSGSELEATLQTIERVNRFLGGSRNVTNVIDSLLPLNPNPTILDAGCGSGDILRELQSRFGQNNTPAQLVGLDANTHILDYARDRTQGAVGNAGFGVHLQQVKDGHASGFAAGAGRGGDGNQRLQFARHRSPFANGWVDVGQKVGGPGGVEIGRLGRVHAGAAAHGYIAVKFAVGGKANGLLKRFIGGLDA